ncbi:S9 family peptidase [Crocinitomix catalasitica]|uniref:S9 family peptidase n=1 Tax=Crocinitomix catalasitica TaxID=184607 RepID=UPI00047FF9EF|nr:S9 family peptidase [Crocinitomix catalasitica]
MTKLLGILTGLFIVTVGFTQGKMTPELLWKLKRVGNIQVSPDHKQILFSLKTYSLKENKGESELYVMPISGGEPKQITDLPGSEFNALWRPDGKKIGFLAKSPTEGTVQIFEMNPDGTELIQISKENGQNMTGFKYFDDGKKILFTADVKMERVNSNETEKDLKLSNARVIDDLMYRHWGEWNTGLRSHIFVAVLQDGLMQGRGVDILKGELIDSPMKPFGGMEQIATSPDGNSVVYTAKRSKGMQYAISTNSEIYNYDLLLGGTSNMSKGNMGYDTEPVYYKDGSKIAWLAMEQDGFESDKNDIIVYDYKSGLKTNITDDEDITVSSFIWGENNEIIYFLAVKNATYQVFVYDFKKSKVKQLTEGMHNYTSIAFAGDKLVAGKQSMNDPTDIFSIDLKTGKDKQLTAVNKEIYDTIQKSRVEERWVETSDGLTELVWVIYPPDFDPKKVYPALLYCQGGPQSAVSQFFSYRWNFQLMAANDYIIIAPNRRGLPGFGQVWNDDISGDWGGQPIRDYLSAVDALVKEPYIDENRVGAVGASYGGYSVYYLAGVHEDRFKCFVSHCGLFNLESWYGTTEELFFANKDIGGPYYNAIKPRSYEKYSPHKLVQNWNTPMLIFHGEKDFRVPLNQGLEAFQALQIKGIDSRMILFPEENHWVLSPQNGVFWHREYYKWLDKYLKEPRQ